jgi:outer membrane protein OmpA-like peptidoglycan-associated protein
MLKNSLRIMLVTALIAVLAGCSGTRKEKGAVIGAAVGGAAGAVIGDQSGNTLLGAIVGAAVGGAAGAYIGNYMDKQAEEMSKELEGAKVERVGEAIKITFPSGLLFDVDEATLQQKSKKDLQDLAGILKKYEDTNIIIEGHTDATGSEEYNQRLSERRAESVAHYLAELGVNPSRFNVYGYGESQPVATNETAAGRQQNRRVDLAVIANEELKARAKKMAD